MKAKPKKSTPPKSGKTSTKGKGLTALEIKGKLASSVRGGAATLFSATTSQQKLK